MKLEGYDILGELDRGGVGEVYLARRRGVRGFEKLVAIKTVVSGGDEARHVAFMDEARLLARLQHPAIAQTFDFGEVEGVPYLVMEYVAGAPLDKVMSEPWPPVAVAQALAVVCDGLHAAHTLTDKANRPLEVVHRDISPQNILLAFDGSVKIIDFGIALMRDRQAPRTEVGVVKGKYAYMAPEQLYGEKVDSQADIFSTGVVLYELLTGKLPFAGANPFKVAEAIKAGDPARPSSLIGTVPAQLDAIVSKALAKKRGDRYASAKEMGVALTEFVIDAGGFDIEAFAKEELSAEREEQQQWVRALLREGPELHVMPFPTSEIGESNRAEVKREATVTGVSTYSGVSHTDIMPDPRVTPTASAMILSDSDVDAMPSDTVVMQMRGRPGWEEWADPDEDPSPSAQETGDEPEMPETTQVEVAPEIPAEGEAPDGPSPNSAVATESAAVTQEVRLSDLAAEESAEVASAKESEGIAASGPDLEAQPTSELDLVPATAPEKPALAAEALDNAVATAPDLPAGDAESAVAGGPAAPVDDGLLRAVTDARLPALWMAGLVGAGAAIAVIGVVALVVLLILSDDNSEEAESADLADAVATDRAGGDGAADGVSRAEARETRHAVIGAARQKGLLRGDSPEIDAARKRILEAHRSGDFAGVRDAAGEALRLIEGIEINDDFLVTKRARFNGIYTRLNNAAKRRQIAPLLSRIIESESAGDHDQANRDLNRAFAILEARVPKRKSIDDLFREDGKKRKSGSEDSLDDLFK